MAHGAGKVYSKILGLGLPILVGQLGQIVVGFADTMMVGRYSTAALASASFVNSVFNVAIFASLGFAYGATPLVAALFSRGKKSDIGSLMRVATLANLLFSILLMGIMGLVYLNLEHLGQPRELLPLIKPYFLIVWSGMIPLSLFNLYAQWSYGVCNSRMPMWIILSANVINIIGNYLLIYGKFGFPEAGLNGAGFSTLSARIFSAAVILGIFFLHRTNRDYRRGFAGGSANTASFLNVNRTSWPVALQMAFETGAFSMGAVMAGWLGTEELAAFQVICCLSTLGFCIYYSIGAAVAVLVGNAAGLDEKQRMRTIAFGGYRLMILLAIAASTVFIMLGERLLGIFSNDPVVTTLAVTLLIPMTFYQLCDATQVTFANALRGTAHVGSMMWISFVSYILIGIPVTYLIAFPCGLGLWGIILSFAVSLCTAGLLFLYFFLRHSRP